VVVVTGASRGIGKGIAAAFAKAGASVAITYNASDAAAAAVIDELNGYSRSLGLEPKHRSYKFDVSNGEAVDRAFDQIKTEMGVPYTVVCNAGITRDGLLLRMKTEDWDQVMATNVRSAFACTKTAMKMMLKAREGSFIYISSVIGETGNPGQANYAASKAALIAFAKSVAQEVASRGIRANCIAPGFIESDMTHALNDEQKAAILTKVPLSRIGSVDDIASACLFLASDFARYVTGHTLDVNGGLYMV
jgi:3-oxoacyl-[acyl-carrier protein] reductase